MTRGPSPLPKNVRELRGAKPAPTAVADEVDLPVKIPDPPDDMSADEENVFVVTARKLASMRVISEADGDALAIYARNWCEAKRAQRAIVESGLIIKSPKGYPITNPYLGIRRRAEEKCLKILQEFGMTPSARTRVSKL